MFLNSNSSLVPPNNNNNNSNINNSNQYLYPAYSCEHLLAPPGCYTHYKSEPNVAFYFNNQSELRRLSDGHYPPSLRRPYPNHYYHYPGEFGGSDTCMLKRKNSSLNMLLDSTSSMMRTASTTFQYLIGSARRASYCGQPDPSVQLAPNGTIGSLYLRSATANSNESSLSNASYDEQRRTVTIYDGRIPSTPVAPTIPFELMTPIDAITQAVDDPVESFVQIVLDTPDDKPPIMPPILVSPARMSLSPRPRPRHRSSSPKQRLDNQQSNISKDKIPLPKLTQHQSMPITETSSYSTKINCQTSDVIEPMDFSFLEPVLRGESAAPPPSSSRNHLSSLCNNNSNNSRQISFQNSSTTENESFELRIPSRSSYLSNRIATIKDDLTSSESSPDDNHDYYIPPSPRLKFTRSLK